MESAKGLLMYKYVLVLLVLVSIFNYVNLVKILYIEQ